MPLKLVTRVLRENAYYHVYNQGLGSREIFIDNEDYQKFLYYLEAYTLTPAKVLERFPDLPVRLKDKNLSDEIQLIAYCLMPDHFHLLVKQKLARSLPKLLKQITNAYTTYFNAKYHRYGAVMKGRYRAVLIESEFIVIQMVRFVHLNPQVAGLCPDPRSYAWSSINNHDKSNELLNHFGSVEEWEKFHLDRIGYESGKEKLRNFKIDY